ncbi:MAG: STAS/SEC14 domain-containing protein [Saprospiraceae bacterium]|nr:MAG: STAS/SEC14 domain-containing protein [Saprospiraceae bacterium]
MTTVEIKPNVKVNLDELFNGVSKLATPELEKFVDKISYIIARRKVPQPARRELELLAKIYEPLAPKTQQRYDLLYARMQQETITDEEHKELLKLIEISEQYNVEWLEALIELAQLKGISVEELMKQLGLNKRKSV